MWRHLVAPAFLIVYGGIWQLFLQRQDRLHDQPDRLADRPTRYPARSHAARRLDADHAAQASVGTTEGAVAGGFAGRSMGDAERADDDVAAGRGVVRGGERTLADRLRHDRFDHRADAAGHAQRLRVDLLQETGDVGDTRRLHRLRAAAQSAFFA